LEFLEDREAIEGGRGGGGGILEYRSARVKDSSGSPFSCSPEEEEGEEVKRVSIGGSGCMVKLDTSTANLLLSLVSN